MGFVVEEAEEGIQVVSSNSLRPNRVPTGAPDTDTECLYIVCDLLL